MVRRTCRLHSRHCLHPMWASANLPSLWNSSSVFSDLGFTSILGLFLMKTSGGVVPSRWGVNVVLCRLCVWGGCPSLPSYPGSSSFLLTATWKKLLGKLLLFLHYKFFPLISYLLGNELHKQNSFMQFSFYFPVFNPISIYFYHN